MKILRTLAMLATLLATPQVFATDVSMADGSVKFSVPDGWMGIMQTEGDPEARVFQVPDPSPTASNTLARVTVLVKKVGDMDGYHQFVEAASSKASKLPDYHSIRNVANSNGPSSYAYTAREGGVLLSYMEQYWFHSGNAIQLRCLRPAQSQAGGLWSNAFDKGCSDLAAQLNH